MRLRTLVMWLFVSLLALGCLARVDRRNPEEDYSYNEYPVSITVGVIGGVLLPLLFLSAVTSPHNKPEKRESDNDTPGLAVEPVPVLRFDYYKYYLTLGWVGPSFSIFSCVLYSLLFHYDSVTATHCKVPNPLPSAAVGNKIPERFFFRFGILIHSSQRVLDSFLIQAWFHKRLPTKYYQFLNRAMCWFNLAENFCLWGLTYIGSSEYYMYHEKSFIFWLIFQTLKSLLQFYLFPIAVPTPNAFQKKSMRVQKWTFAVNVASVLAAGGLFVLHNTVCLPYVYALYALAEYIAVGTNIYFNYHMSLMVGEGQRLYLSFDVDKPKTTTQ